jgi:hypothetical protein
VGLSGGTADGERHSVFAPREGTRTMESHAPGIRLVDGGFGGPAGLAYRGATRPATFSRFGADRGRCSEESRD